MYSKSRTRIYLNMNKVLTMLPCIWRIGIEKCLAILQNDMCRLSQTVSYVSTYENRSSWELLSCLKTAFDLWISNRSLLLRCENVLNRDWSRKIINANCVMASLDIFERVLARMGRIFDYFVHSNSASTILQSRFHFVPY